jgi:hypothetical protein
MSNRNPFEGTDWYLDSEYAAFFGQELETFRSKVHANRIFHKKWGHNLLLQRSVVLDNMETIASDEPKKKKQGPAR